eukprot:7596103-Heterocapsa_arctica.AAC.1
MDGDSDGECGIPHEARWNDAEGGARGGGRDAGHRHDRGDGRPAASDGAAPPRQEPPSQEPGQAGAQGPQQDDEGGAPDALSEWWHQPDGHVVRRDAGEPDRLVAEGGDIERP